MRKIITAIITVTMLLAFTGCKADQKLNDMLTGEWVSPDGVHYWNVGYGIAPRYDNNGELVIDKMRGGADAGGLRK